MPQARDGAGGSATEAPAPDRGPSDGGRRLVPSQVLPWLRVALLTVLVAGTVVWPIHAARSATREVPASAAMTATQVPHPSAGASAPATQTAPLPQPSAAPSAAGTDFTPPPVTRTDPDGMPHTDAVGDGTWLTAPAQAAAPGYATVHRYILLVEGGTGIDPAQAAPLVSAYLNDPRGWPGRLNVSFEAVTDPAAAEFRLHLATPPTINQLCAPMAVNSTWSCRNGGTVNLNADRWSYLVPWIQDAATYRAYLVNHEVGHWLGFEHERCAGPGRYAPLMMQQSKGLFGCVANPWVTQDGQEPSG